MWQIFTSLKKDKYKKNSFKRPKKFISYFAFLGILSNFAWDISLAGGRKAEKSPRKTSRFHTKSLSKVPMPVEARKLKYAAIVMDASTGQVLHEEYADAPRYPASLTKMMTLYIVFEKLRKGELDLKTPMYVSAYAASQAPTKLYLQEGEILTVENAILGLVTKSANDAAVVVAEHLAGSEAAFARQMTRKARWLGMKNTIFKNPHGLPNPQQVSTARDLALLSQALHRDFPKYYGYFSIQSFKHKGIVHRNHNHLLGRVEGVDGIKTGLTNASGFNLAASALRYTGNNQVRRLITVVLGGPNRHWRDKRVEELFERYFQKPPILSSKPLLMETKHQSFVSEVTLDDLIYEACEEEPGITKPCITPTVAPTFKEDVIEELLNERPTKHIKTMGNARKAPRVMPVGWVKGKAPKPTFKLGKFHSSKPKKIHFTKVTPNKGSRS